MPKGKPEGTAVTSSMRSPLLSTTFYKAVLTFLFFVIIVIISMEKGEVINAFER
jgi:hypothetical protein